MKKSIYVLIIMVLILVGCGKKDKVTECNMSSDQSASGYKMNIDYKIYSDNNIVNKVTINQVIESNKDNILEDFKKDLEKQYKAKNDVYGGYKYDISKKNNKLSIKVNIDYNKFDLKKFVDDNAAMRDYVDEDYKLTLDGAVKLYESTSAKCKKNK